jgi:hypothetical protein
MLLSTFRKHNPYVILMYLCSTPNTSLEPLSSLFAASSGNTLYIIVPPLSLFRYNHNCYYRTSFSSQVYSAHVDCYWSGDIFTRPRGPGEREIIKRDRDGCCERQDDGDDMRNPTRPAPIHPRATAVVVSCPATTEEMKIERVRGVLFRARSSNR